MQHLASLNGLSLGNNLLALGKDQLDVAGVRHVWVDLERQLVMCSQTYGRVATYATVCTVCAAALLWCLVDLDVLYDKVTGIEALGIGVGLSVLEETKKELGRLDGPAGAGDTESLAYRSISPCSCKISHSKISCGDNKRTLGGATGSAGVPPHGNGLLVLLDVLEELHGTLELPAIDGLGGLAGVLEGHTEVCSARASRLRRVDFGGSVSNL